MSDVEQEDGILECWCGARGTFSQLFDTEVYERGCGGSGILDCQCGGDQCVCHHHGEVECDGCADCMNDEDDYHDYFEDDEDP